MGLKATPCVQCSHHVLLQSVVYQPPISSIASSSLTRCSKRGQIFVCKISLSSTSTSKKLLRSQYLKFNRHASRGGTIKRSCSANLDEVFDEESFELIKGLSHKFDLFDDEENEEERRTNKAICTASLINSIGDGNSKNSFLQSKFDLLEPIMLGIRPEAPEWPEREAIMRVSIERKANRIEIPLSIRMIKKKKLWKVGFRDSGVSAFCSMKKALSSMVFIILELQSYTLQMREVVQYEDFEGITDKVQREMQASFVWMFQQVFSRTPSLMIHVMILLANFSVYSTAHNIGIVDPSLLEPVCETTIEKENQQHLEINSSESSIQILSRSSLSIQYPNVVPEEISRVGFQEFNTAAELSLWNSMVDEAREMQKGSWDVVLDHEDMRSFVSPVTVDLELDDSVENFRTDLLYQMRLSREPNNTVLMCNYAQFLYLVAHDYDRAEECFKRAIQVEPVDAESLSQYADFLWLFRKDLWGAEERYIQAMAAGPNSRYHASKYANFLWSTGGEETCYPLDTPPHDNTTASN